MHSEAATSQQASQETGESKGLRPESNRISIWFFIGALLLVYGVLILGAGIHDWLRPPAQEPVLAELHAGIWMGGVLVLLGSIYSYRFFPKKDQ
jgi:uncharacterized membrane protein